MTPRPLRTWTDKDGRRWVETPIPGRSEFAERSCLDLSGDDERNHVIVPAGESTRFEPPAMIPLQRWLLPDGHDYTVRLSAEARRSIANWPFELEREISASLYGRVYSRTIDVLEVGRETVSFSSTSAEPDLDQAEEEADWHRSRGTGIVCVGDVHVHPTPQGHRSDDEHQRRLENATQPSAADLRFWTKRWYQRKHDEPLVYAGLIVAKNLHARDAGTWMYPRFGAWVLERADGRLFARETRVEIDPRYHDQLPGWTA